MPEPVTEPHEPAKCVRLHQPRSMCGGGRTSGHTDAFRCPSCGREGRFALNYLGRRQVVCNGVKFTRELPT